MEKFLEFLKYFSGVELTEEHNGYFYSVWETLLIVIPGSLCGLRNVSQISQWAENERVYGFLSEQFGIKRVPCYYWLPCLLKIIKPESLNERFINWVRSFLPDNQFTISLDGKTVRSTGKMEKHENALHIISAQIAELGITFGQAVDGKTNEIPAMRDLLNWKDMACIGAIHISVSSKKGGADGWHFYISSRRLPAKELLRHARLEWSVETMHWLLDVDFGENLVEDKNTQQNLNMAGKIALNAIKLYKTVQNRSWRQAPNIKNYVGLPVGVQ